MDLFWVHATERSLLSQRIAAKENKQVEHAGRMMKAVLFKVSEASCASFYLTSYRSKCAPVHTPCGVMDKIQ
ncbi:unnamed protein product [Musa textilis]